MRLLTIAVVILLALAGASCGGDDEESSDEDTITFETTTDDTTTDETTDETTTDDETTDDSGDSLASEDCQDLISASAALGQAFGGAQSGEDLSESSEAFTEFAENAPDEIRSDLELMAETYAAYVDALEDIGLDPGETPSADQAVEFQQALASIDLEEFSAASQRFTTWAGANCQP
jgi:hypothetical protein